MQTPNSPSERQAVGGRRDGFTIALALLAITVIGGLIAGIFYASTQEYRISRNGMLQARAQAAAEYGMNRAMYVDWNSGQGKFGTPMAVGTTDSTTFVYPNASLGVASLDGATTTVRITKLSAGTFPIWLISSEGRAGRTAANQAYRKVSVTATVNPLRFNMLGALTTHGSTKIGGSSYIDGMDTTSYGGWGCPPPSPTTAKPGIATDNPANISTAGCNNLKCIDGSPDTVRNALAADTNTYFSYGSATWNSLVAMAKTVYGNPTGPALLPIGTCDTSPWTNWGDPTRGALAGPCANYFPILYSPTDLHLTGGKGQGILLVNGSLMVDGGFEFYGPVIVRGDLDTQGTGGHFNGGVMAANVNLAQNTVLGNAVVKYSSCIVNTIMNNVSPPQPLPLRAWSEGF